MCEYEMSSIERLQQFIVDLQETIDERGALQLELRDRKSEIARLKNELDSAIAANYVQSNIQALMDTLNAENDDGVDWGQIRFDMGSRAYAQKGLYKTNSLLSLHLDVKASSSRTIITTDVFLSSDYTKYDIGNWKCINHSISRAKVQFEWALLFDPSAKDTSVRINEARYILIAVMKSLNTGVYPNRTTKESLTDQIAAWLAESIS